MGLFRKVTSMSTLGAVDFRSDKERTARYTRQTRNAVRAGNQQQLTGYRGPQWAYLYDQPSQDVGEQQRLAELTAREAVLADRVARLASDDPVIRAGALAEVKAAQPGPPALVGAPAPGWYWCQGDPPRTVRYFTGSGWGHEVRQV